MVPVGSPPLGEVEDLLFDIWHHLGGALVTADGVEELAVLLQGHAFQKDTPSLEFKKSIYETMRIVELFYN